jgi:GDP-L-fucose synthase
VSANLDLSGKRIFVAGHRGMVGSALVRRLASEPVEIVTVPKAAVDLRDCRLTSEFLDEKRPDIVVIAAAKVGGILANETYPADFLYDNLMIEANLIHGSHAAGVRRLLFLGSSCIYPRLAPQPLREDALLTGPLEPTNQWYAIAKIAGIKLCDAYRAQHGHSYISAMPTNLYGPGDNFDLETSHVVPALIRKIDIAARESRDRVEIWGTGTPLREFMHVDDLADALVFLLRHYDESGHINVGTGVEISIADLAAMIARIVGFRGEFSFDRSRPDGTPRKIMDSSRLAALSWRPQIDLERGLAEVYRWYRGSDIATHSDQTQSGSGSR